MVEGCPIERSPTLAQLACTSGGDASCDVARPACTEWSASWCPACGDCRCPYDEHRGWGPGVFDEPYAPDCPLHGTASNHAGEPEVLTITSKESP